MQNWVFVGMLSWGTISLVFSLMIARLFMVMSDTPPELGVESSAPMVEILKSVVKSQPGVMRLKSFLRSSQVIG